MIHFDIESKEKELKELEEKTVLQEFWLDNNNSGIVLKQINNIKSKIEKYKKIKSDLENIKDLNELLQESPDESLENELINSIKNIKKEVEKLEINTLLSDKYDINNIDCVMYNLGYLPKGDKSIHTISTDTLESLKKVLKLMNKDGIISICFYPGFPSGKEESILLDNYLRTIDQKEFDVLKYNFINQVNDPPYLVLIRKR